MSAPKRRLSSGSGLLSLCADDDSDDDDDLSVTLQDKSIYTFPKKNNSRRRSSFGGANSSKSPVNAAEQARIAEMYKLVIQMSSENKLNEKNSWNYDLIDHMGNLIKDDNKGVNFQKASCTLDASVKIYSNRVDDTYTSSHRILESLSRNGTSAADQDEDDGGDHDADDGEAPEGGRKKGNKTSNRLNIATTIERNVAALNAVKLENDVAVDPMFHKISKAFDEGGAKGMLMNNLRVASTGCSLSFHFPAAYAEAETKDAAPTPAGSATIDLADLLNRADIPVASLTELSVCPALAMYRDQIGLPEDTTYLGALRETLTSTAAHAWPTAAAIDTVAAPTRSSVGASEINANTAWDDDNDDHYGDFGNDMGDDDGGFDDDHQSRASAPFTSRLSAVASPNADDADRMGSKLRWEELESVPAGGVTKSMAADMEMIVQGMESIAISNSGPSEYSYFDSNAAFGSSNAWAGSKHWKYATRKRTALTAPAVAEESAESTVADTAVEEETGAKKGRGGKKPTKKAATTKKTASAAGIEFTADLVDESEFDLPKAKAKTDPTLQTAATLAKHDAESDALFLPVDAKVQIKDLCRLYLAPLVMMPANDAQRTALAQSALAAKQRSGSSKIDKFLGGQSGSERVWGLAAPASQLQTATRVTVPGPGSQNLNSFGDDGDDGYYGGDYCGDDGDDAGCGDYDNQENLRPGKESAKPPVLTGLSINEGQLLQAERKVEKIEIGYAKVSKRVNIQRLKADIWGHVRTSLPAADGDSSHDAENRRSSTDSSMAKGGAVSGPSEALSFQHMISELAAGDEVRQRDVTLPFYFICLLHLANEHNLKIEDRADMSDLIITPGMK